MAVEAERLLAIFEARFSSLEKSLTKARTNAQKSFGDIEAAGTRAENALAKVGSRGTPGMNKASAAIRSTRFETANLAAQFQDIGVQLAGGQSPFLIAIQQGTQLNQVLGQTGARGAVSLLGGAFRSMLNPVSLATIAVIGLGGAAVQYFAQLFSDGAEAEKTLQAQADLIQKVADRWGGAVPALKEYAEELKRAAESADIGAAGEAASKAKLDEAKAKLVELSNGAQQLLQSLRLSNVSADLVADLDRAFRQLRADIDDNNKTADNAQAVNAALTNVINAGADSAADYASSFRVVSDEMAGLIRQSAALDAQTKELKKTLAVTGQLKQNSGNLGQLSPLYSGGGRFMNEQEAQNFRAENTKSQFRIDREKLARSGSRSGLSDAEREQQQIDRVIESLEFEQAQLHRTNLEQQIYNQLKAAGVERNSEAGQKIEALVTAKYREKEATDQQARAYQNLQRIGETALNGLATAMADGKIEGRELLSILVQIAQQLLSMPSGGKGGILSSIGSLLGLGGGGFAASDFAILANPGLYHSGGIAGSPKSRRAVPAGIFANAPRYHDGGIAGLRSGEVPAILKRGELVLPTNGTMASAGASVTYAPSYTIHSEDGDPRKIVAAIERYDKGRLARLKADLPDLRRRAGKRFG